MSGITLTEVANATIPTPASGKATLFQSTDEGGPAFKDDAGSVTPLRGADGADGADGALTYLDHGNTGSTETVDASAADIHRLVADAATVTITLTGAPSAGTPGIIRLWLEQDGTGGRDWAFPGSVDFGDPGEPDWTTRSGGAVDLVDLVTVDGGTTWIATVAGREGPPPSEILDIGTAETDDTLVLAPDGAGGVEWRAESGGSGNLAGTELDYVAFTSPVSVTGTTEGASNTVVSGSSVAYDGSTVIQIEFFSPSVVPQASANAFIVIMLYDSASIVGWLAQVRVQTAAAWHNPVRVAHRLTPSAASHTYVIKAMTSSGTSTINAGSGGTGAYLPGFIRITRVSA